MSLTVLWSLGMQDAKSWSNSASFMLIGRTDGHEVSRAGVHGSSSLNLPPFGQWLKRLMAYAILNARMIPIACYLFVSLKFS